MGCQGGGGVTVPAGVQLDMALCALVWVIAPRLHPVIPEVFSSRTDSVIQWFDFCFAPDL